MATSTLPVAEPSTADAVLVVAPEAPSTFAEALARALDEDGRTLDAVQRRLAALGTPLSPAMLSYWRNGRSVPTRASSRAAVLSLEQVLGLAPGSLAALVPASGTRMPVGPREAELPEDARDSLREVLAELELGTDQELVDVTVHISLDVGADGSLERDRLRNLVRATRDGARRLPTLAMDVADGGNPAVTVGPGARLGRIARRAAAGVWAAEVVLDRPLTQGEVAVVDYGEEFTPSTLFDTTLEYAALRRLREATVWVRFAEGRVPREVVAVHDTPEGMVEAPVALVGTSASLTLLDFGPGRMGLRWEW